MPLPLPLRYIYYVKEGVQRNWRQLFLSVTCSVFTEGECGIYLFLFLTYMFTSNPQNVHVKKLWTHKIPIKKNFGPTKPARKIFEPTKYTREKILDPRRYDGTRPT